MPSDLIVCASCGEEFRVRKNGVWLRVNAVDFRRGDLLGCGCGARIITRVSEGSVKGVELPDGDEWFEMSHAEEV